MATFSDELYSLEVIRIARRRGTPTQFMHSSKLLHGWLPVMHMHGHTTRILACPGCDFPSEMVDHLFQCSHPFMQKARDDSFILFRAKCQRIDLPLASYTAFTEYVHSTLLGQPPPTSMLLIIQQTIRQQNLIGQGMILHGFLAKGWAVTLLRANTMLPHQTVAKLLRLIWDVTVAQGWSTRNDILHHQANHNTTLENDSLGTRLDWFHNHHVEALSYHDRFLINFDLTDIVGMSHEVRRALVTNLEVAHAAYLLERTHQPRQQHRIMTDFERKPN